MSAKFILRGHTPELEADLFTWAKWFEAAGEECVVADDEVAGARVFTFFLGVDMSFDRAPHEPILFETQVVGGTWDRDGERCSTWTQAEAQHARWVERVKTPNLAPAAERDDE